MHHNYSLFVEGSYDLSARPVMEHEPKVSVQLYGRECYFSLHFDDLAAVYTFIDRLAKAAATLDAQVDYGPAEDLTPQDIAQALAGAGVVPVSVIDRPVTSPLLS